MELLAGLGTWPGAVLLKQSGTAYLLVNASHILGIALLIGAILPLDLRLLGVFRSVPVAALAPVLSRMAAVGLGLALVSGAWLFTVRPVEYAGNAAFLWKLGLLALALANIALQHRSAAYARALEGDITAAVRWRALASLTLWPGTLLAGRWIGFL
ncbi:MAG: DUF2214 domain-containing protein [Bosea sp. (in: a-proteobacteria)]|uniref:DUF6644 family protein n=1 Tax=Bosea sp. (in: a-proteobacteria) TaxID=1871050 RepID=UPI002736304B|nr:DUF6644 family protein [Bosea sp. (in: a-proteobacteria)]MDP3258521.1 DUF2214 domain-containing protein [Bosea sp. (in: a-proteobacteria)]MDP3317977.1 DUF2214 domain-containing protein [Bosea sp. (in: a-proteobacteria)]